MPLNRYSRRHKRTFGKRKPEPKVFLEEHRVPPKPTSYYTKMKGRCRFCGILIRKKDGGKPTKEQVLEWVQSRSTFSWPKKKLKSGPRKGQEINDPGCFDMADAFVIAQAGHLNLTNTEKI